MGKVVLVGGSRLEKSCEMGSSKGLFRKVWAVRFSWSRRGYTGVTVDEFYGVRGLFCVF